MSDALRWEVMLPGSKKPLTLLADAEEEEESPDRDREDTVSDQSDGSGEWGCCVDLLMPACLLSSPGQIAAALAWCWLVL